jgi:hypothetical protein
MQGENGDQKHFLLVGDWVIDEYWFLLRHHSDMSSHTGKYHFRTAIQPGELFKDLYGADHVARGLYYLNNNSVSHYKIIGIGRWNAKDTHYLNHLVHSKLNDDCMSPTVSKSVHHDSNYCDQNDDSSVCLKTLNPDNHTIQVIRQFHQRVHGFDQIKRVDWDFQNPQQSGDWFDFTFSELNHPDPNQVEIIAFHDFKRGLDSTPKCNDNRRKGQMVGSHHNPIFKFTMEGMK